MNIFHHYLVQVYTHHICLHVHVPVALDKQWLAMHTCILRVEANMAFRLHVPRRIAMVKQKIMRLSLSAQLVVWHREIEQTVCAINSMCQPHEDYCMSMCTCIGIHVATIQFSR